MDNLGGLAPSLAGLGAFALMEWLFPAYPILTFFGVPVRPFGRSSKRRVKGIRQDGANKTR